MIHWLMATLRRELVFERRGHCLHVTKGDNWAYCCQCPLDVGEGEYLPWGCAVPSADDCDGQVQYVRPGDTWEKWE